MMTSYFANARHLPEDCRPVSISRFAKFWKGDSCIELAPSGEMLHMSKSDYDAAYALILSRLDPQSIFDRLGSNAVLLCYEKPGDHCHRRAVAEWLESHLGIVIPEFGFTREQCPAYADLPVIGYRPPDKKPKVEPVSKPKPQKELF